MDIKLSNNNFIACDSEYKSAEIVMFSAPFDSTTSFRPGTRFGPNAIRNESYGIETFSPYMNKDLTEKHIIDIGDLDIVYGNSRETLNIIKNATSKILKDDKKPILIGGEHLVSLGSIEACFEENKEMVLLHFDAHADLRDEYLGEELSHATVIRRAWDLLGDGKIYQFGIRSGDKSEFEWSNKHTHMEKFNYSTLKDVIEDIKDKPIYVSIDLDVLDPSVFPGTGTPEAGGIFFQDIINILKQLIGLNIVGFDLVELAPNYDNSGISTAMAVKILREVLLIY